MAPDPRPPEGRPRRHDLVWLRSGWRDALLGLAEPGRLAAAAAWFARGRPAVGRRLGAGEPVGAVALGIPLPPAEGRLRIALLVTTSAVERVEPPLRLSEGIESAPAAWRPSLRALDAEAREAGLSVGLHGSLAWQHITGEAYLARGSDVDLLLAPRNARELGSALDLLRSRAREVHPRLDGEILLGQGRSVAWRELLAAAGRVLVKSETGVALEPSARALGAFSGDLAP